MQCVHRGQDTEWRYLLKQISIYDDNWCYLFIYLTPLMLSAVHRNCMHYSFKHLILFCHLLLSFWAEAWMKMKGQIFKLSLKYNPCFRMTMNQYMSRTSQILLASFSFFLFPFCCFVMTHLYLLLSNCSCTAWRKMGNR